MERVEFLKKKKKVLKIIAVTLTVLLFILSVIAIVYIRFGIAGFLQNPIAKSVFGIDKQQNLGLPTIAQQEIDDISDVLGYDIGATDREDLTSNQKASLTASPQGMTYLMNTLLINKDSLKNLQVNATENGELEVSAVADVTLVCEMIGQDKETIESSVGKLPDQVTIYAAVIPGTKTGTTSITSIKIGQIGVPGGIYSAINGYIDDGVDLLFTNAFGIDVDDISIDDQKITIVGEFPAP
jgi:hypothetical protein